MHEADVNQATLKQNTVFWLIAVPDESSGWNDAKMHANVADTTMDGVDERSGRPWVESNTMRPSMGAPGNLRASE